MGDIGGTAAALLATLILAHAGGYAIVHIFSGHNGDGAGPAAALSCDARSSCGVVFEISPNGAETVLHSFDNADAGNPLGSLFKDRTGNLYGTTFSGGKNNDGVVFKLSPDGTETVLHFFGGLSDGKYPRGGVISDNGNLYGTTLVGGGVFRLRKQPQ